MAIVSADFNNDGNLDLATANDGTYNLIGGSISVLLGDGQGGFGAASHFVAAASTRNPWRSATSTMTATSTWRR